MRLAWFQDKTRWPGGSIAVHVCTLLTHVYDVYLTAQAPDRIPKPHLHGSDTSDFLSDAMSCGDDLSDSETPSELESHINNTLPLRTNDALGWYRVSITSCAVTANPVLMLYLT